MFTAAKYRAMADNCRRLARDLDDQSRVNLELLAQEYEDEAVRADCAARSDAFTQSASV